MGFGKKFKKAFKKVVVKPVVKTVDLVKRGHIIVTTGTNGTKVRTTN